MSSAAKPRGLFVNPAAASCSIHESGQMAHRCLRLSDRFDLDYAEVDQNHRRIGAGYDFYVFNYHHVTMAWLDTAALGCLGAPKITFVLEVLPGDPFSLCPRDAFDAYCALDPTMHSRDRRVYAFPRPLEVASAATLAREVAGDVPVIGTFGFATRGKGFERVVRAVNAEFERAKIRLNIPFGDYADKARTYAHELAENCRRLAKPGVEVVVTHDFMPKEELIGWCRENTLNCFLYDRNMAGLAATTDQAVSSGRPLAVSANATFRHLIDYVQPYPMRSLRESLERSPEEVTRMQRDWAPEKFAHRFEQVLDGLGLFKSPAARGGTAGTPVPPEIELPKLVPHNALTTRLRRVLGKLHVSDFTPPVVTKAARRLRRVWKPGPPSKPAIHPFTHRAFGSFSQFHEDLLIDLIFAGREEGFYLDVGANDPEFNSNSLRFYRRGWSGVCVEPGAEAFRRIAQHRPKDLNLNVAIGPERSRMTFYRVVDDSTLSSLDEATARRMAAMVGSTVAADEVDVLPLRDIFAEHTGGRQVDFLSVDAEGYDLEVLRSNDWERHRPTLLLVEINNQFGPIVQLLSEHNFLLIFNNPDNGLFVDKHTADPGVRRVLGHAALI